MTDDLVMGAIYQRNVCTAVVEALNAGVDLLLVAFDGAQFYRIFTCAVAASAEGRLDAAMLGDSEARLKGAFPGERQNLRYSTTLDDAAPIWERHVARQD